ncbi:hypothetical protein CK222_22320 [Mesorhizobium sp. WSM3866]|uniref:DUF4365 domain-containing protein n=1 Tax=Mesorhizobium sp. WSM3866 TaxID=422271 RepID=UPI000BAF8B39|nr:DUF4365 domain-containing protein [Mesorhizobium sp. WSM3866]PBB41308.1 hypothetical protein CK222_22320 [Mesorhizobium sp. WSM3866]
MQPLSSQNIESELSYAYLHAVASSAGAACTGVTRHQDNAGVDAKLTGWGPFPEGGYLTEVDINVQLKATTKAPSLIGNTLSYSLVGIQRYDDLRALTLSTARILVVLFMPKDSTDWLEHTDDALSLRKCAYWVSLRGAPASENETSQTVYLPKSQRFDALGLSALMATISRNEQLAYKGEAA